MAKKSVKRVCYSLKSHAKTLLEVSGGGENEEEEEETLVRKVEIGVRKREWEFQGDREEERVWCFLERDLVERSACENLWCDGHPSYPVYAIGMAEDF